MVILLYMASIRKFKNREQLTYNSKEILNIIKLIELGDTWRKSIIITQ